MVHYEEKAIDFEFHNKLMKEDTMRKGLFGLALLVVIISMSLGGCASMREMCGTEKEQKKIIEASQPPPAVVRPTPPPAAVTPPPPPPKKARN